MSKRSVVTVEPSLSPFSTSEETTLRVMSIMFENYGALPREFWGLSKAADLLAPRGFIVDKENFQIYRQRFESCGTYPIVSVRTLWWSMDDSLIILPGVKTVRIGSHDFNGNVVLDEGVEEVTFHELSGFNRPLELPSTLRKLVLGRSYNRPTTLPSGLTELVFDWFSDFDQRIALPGTLRIATFGWSFDQPLTLPPLLEELKLAHDFNQDLDLSTSSKLRVVTFSNRFNRPVRLTDSLESVWFGDRFNQALTLPPNLRRLKLGKSFNFPLTLPPRLEELVFCKYGGVFNHALTLVGNSLRKLELPDRFSHPIALPEGLESVYFGEDWNFPLTLPSTLTELTFARDSKFNQPLDFPDGLRSASFGVHMEEWFTYSLGLRKLEWNSNVAMELPDGLEHVIFGPAFKQALTLPSTLKSIKLHHSYNLPLVLPPGCRRVTTYN